MDEVKTGEVKITQKEIYQALKKVLKKEDVEKKNRGNYLSWSVAMEYLFENFDNVEYRVIENQDGLYHFGNAEMGYFVKTEITIEGITKGMHLPVFDNMYNAMLKPTVKDINKAIMRCFAKNAAMFGAGMQLYKGEDLEDLDDSKNEKSNVRTTTETITEEQANEIKAKLVEKVPDTNKRMTLIQQMQKYNKVETLRELPADKYNNVIDYIDKLK